MFVRQEMPLPVSPDTAQARLLALASRPALGKAAEAAYEGGLEQLRGVGPLDGTPETSKLVRALFLEPVWRDGAVTVGMRWEATGRSGSLVPVLDANISVVLAGD